MCSAWMVRGNDDDSASHGSVSAFHGRILKVVQSTMVCLSLSAGWESLLIYRESHRSPRPATVSQHDNTERWHRVVLLLSLSAMRCEATPHSLTCRATRETPGHTKRRRAECPVAVASAKGGRKGLEGGLLVFWTGTRMRRWWTHSTLGGTLVWRELGASRLWHVLEQPVLTLTPQPLCLTTLEPNRHFIHNLMSDRTNGIAAVRAQATSLIIHTWPAARRLPLHRACRL